MQKSLLFLFLFFLNAAAAYTQSYFFQRTLRIDLFHTGNARTEVFSLDGLMEEPYYSGPINNALKVCDYGTHKFQLIDAETEEVIFSKGWNSLFHEWQSTSEAQKTSRTFPESLLMPYPRKPCLLKVFTRDRNGIWQEKFVYAIYPDNIFVSKEKRKPSKYFDVHVNSNVANTLDIVFLADGYTAMQMVKFRRDCRKFADNLLSCSPFKENKLKINIRAVESVSLNQGTDNPGLNIWANTALNTGFYTFGTERYLTTSDIRTLRDYASNVTYDHIIVIVNSKEYGGGGFYNFYSLATSDNEHSAYLLIHEFGHGLAGLADEYYTSDVPVIDYYNKLVEPWEPNITTLIGFEKKWKSQLGDATPIPTPANHKYYKSLGAFEGAGYSAKGIYRPQWDCTMKSVSWNNFCPVCQQSIQKVIDFYCLD